ncbi:MAG: diversity-generating retroelement protein Avd [Anaerolineae bacterium]|nr:diversity-generating retroelement protein Avd [Anaerolineae bacterium]
MTTPLFTKTFDLTNWLLAVTNHFPRSQRFIVTKRLLDAALDFQERLVEANSERGKARLARLDLADAELDKVRLYLRLAFRWQWIDEGQYGHGARLVAEVGRLLGTWKQNTAEAVGQIKRQPAATSQVRTT